MAGQLLPSDILTQVVQSLLATDYEWSHWMSLRLVNRFFNHEVLFATFVVRIGRFEAVYNTTYPTGKLQRLIAGWSLAGALIRAPSHDKDYVKLFDVIHMANKHLTEWVGGNEPNSSTSLMTHWVSVSSLFADKTMFSARIAQLVCDALVSAIPTDSITTSSIFEPLTTSAVFNYTASEMIYLMTCFIGDVSLLRRALEHMTEDLSSRTTSASIVTGLQVAARQGREEVLEHLLDAGHDPNTPEDAEDDSVVSAAAESGNVRLIRLLLRPDYNLDLSNRWIGNAVINAAELPDPMARKEIVKILWSNAKIREKAYVRGEVLCCAGRLNDPEIAEFILADGPADLYDAWNVPPQSRHPVIVAADYGSASVLRLILNAPFTEVPNHSFYRELRQALKTAKQNNDLPTFLELMPHLDGISTNGLSYWAAGIDHGIETINNISGPFDFDVEYTRSDNDVCENILGPQLLCAAVNALRTQNVNWLSARGIRTQNLIRVDDWAYRKHPNEYNRMAELLVSHQNPGIDVGTQKYPGPTWTSQLVLPSTHHSTDEPPPVTSGSAE